MRFNTLKTFAAVAVIAVTAMSGQANAQLVDNQDVNVNIATNSAIDVQHEDDIEFGTWFVIVRSGETPTLTIAPGGPASAVVGGATDSDLTELIAGAGPGLLTVEVPAATVMTMTRGALGQPATTPFPDGSIELTAVTYATATENGNVDADGDDGAVTVAAGATAEPVNLGAVLTFNATPDDDLSPHTATFNLQFAY